MLTEREEMIVRFVRELRDGVAREMRDKPEAPAVMGALDAAATLIEQGAHLKRPSPTISASEWVRTPSVG